jgi:hypothetical protein
MKYQIGDLLVVIVRARNGKKLKEKNYIITDIELHEDRIYKAIMKIKDFSDDLENYLMISKTGIDADILAGHMKHYPVGNQ